MPFLLPSFKGCCLCLLTARLGVEATVFWSGSPKSPFGRVHMWGFGGQRRHRRCLTDGAANIGPRYLIGPDVMLQEETSGMRCATDHTWEQLKDEIIEEALELCENCSMAQKTQVAWRQCFMRLAKTDDMLNEKSVHAANVLLQCPILVLEGDVQIAHLCVPRGNSSHRNEQHFHAGFGNLDDITQWVAMQGSLFHIWPSQEEGVRVAHFKERSIVLIMQAQTPD
eukprot:2110382-Amphidinium_carterae.1